MDGWMDGGCGTDAWDVCGGAELRRMKISKKIEVKGVYLLRYIE